MSVPFSPPVAPSHPLEDQRSPRVNVAQFGDSYNQRAADGINHDLETINVKWESLTPAEAKAIFDFFEARGGHESFTYTLPWWGNDVNKKYVCPKYSRQKAGANDFMITASWRELRDQT